MAEYLNYYMIRLFVIFFLISTYLDAQQNFRVWRDINDRTVRAKFIAVNGSYVLLERESDRMKMTFPISQLSEYDQKKILGYSGSNSGSSRAKSMNINDYKGILLRSKKWTNQVGGRYQKFFFSFKLDKVDNDRDGSPEGSKVIVQQLWYGGRENNIKSKIIDEHACVGSWTVNEDGRLEIRLGKCYPDKDAQLYYYNYSQYSHRDWTDGGYPPRNLCSNKRAHAHNSSCGCPFQGNGVWRYDKNSKSFRGSSDNDSWQASIYPI